MQPTAALLPVDACGRDEAAAARLRARHRRGPAGDAIVERNLARGSGDLLLRR